MNGMRAYYVVILIAAAVAFVAIAFGHDFFFGTLGWPPRLVIELSLLLVLAVAIPVLWRALLRDWSRRPDGSDSRKKSDV